MATGNPRNDLGGRSAGRLHDSLLRGLAYNKGTSHPVLNAAYGGAHGYTPLYTEWVNNASYVQRNVIALLMEAPAFFQMMDKPHIWVSTLRSMIELHPKSIEGLNMTLTVETGETPVGGAGEQQEEVINVTRARSTPTFTYNDKYGRPFQRFLEYWITYGLMDPASKVANIGTMETYPTDMLPDRYSMTCLFIEPDPTHRQVLKSCLCTNMYPKGTGDIVGRRDLTSALTIPELSIEFTALTQVGAGVDLLGQEMLDAINITQANPNMRKAFVKEIDADVKAVGEGEQAVGYKANVEKTSAEAGEVDLAVETNRARFVQ